MRAARRRAVPPICASAAAMMTRCFSPPLSVVNGAILEVRGAGRGQRLARDRDVAPAPRSRTRRDAGSGPSARLRARVKSNASCVSCGTTAIRRAIAGRDNVRQIDVRPASRGRASRLQRAGQAAAAASSCRSRSGRAGRRSRRPARSSDTPRSTGCAAVVGELTSAARSNPQPHHAAAAERREPERFLVVAIEQVRRRGRTTSRPPTMRNEAPSVPDVEPGLS